MSFRAALVLGSFAVHAAGASVHTQPWLYGEVNSRGPSNWDTATSNPVCKTGTEQSPINIQGVTADSGLKPLEMHYTAALGFDLINNQHSVKVVPTNNDGNYLLDPNNGNKRYNLAQMHFHSPSEHGIGGGLYDLELHMVHVLADTTDTNEKFQYLVVGTLFTAGSAPNENFGFFDRLPTVPMSGFDNYANASAEYAYRMSTETTNFDFAGLLASRRFYTYDGSFTTPPCTEGVKWYVRQEVGVVSTAQLTAFRNAMMFTQELVVADNLGWKPSTFQYFGDNRPLQPLNSRNVRSFEDSHAGEDRDHEHEDDDDKEETRIIVAIALSGMALCIASAALCRSSHNSGCDASKPDLEFGQADHRPPAAVARSVDSKPDGKTGGAAEPTSEDN